TAGLTAKTIAPSAPGNPPGADVEPVTRVFPNLFPGVYRFPVGRFCPARAPQVPFVPASRHLDGRSSAFAPATFPACANSARTAAFTSSPKGNSFMTATLLQSAAPPEVKPAPAAIAVSGIVEMADGHAFVRTSGYRRDPADVYVSAGQIRQYGLRKGDRIEGAARSEAAPRSEGARANGTARGKFHPLVRVDTVNGMSPELARARPHFDDLTPLYPDQRLRLEDGDASATARIIDLIAPIGKGQRGL